MALGHLQRFRVVLVALRERLEVAARGRAHYRDVFDRRVGEERTASCAVVLADLARFCHAADTTHVVGDSHGSAQLEGRRQVWLRIQGFLCMTDEQLARLNEQALRGEIE